MSGIACFGFWTCAAIYAATGLIGLFLIGAQPGIASSSDGYGYGTIRVMAATQTPVRP